MIKLNSLETKLFDTFRTFLKARNMKSTLRVAGGWVRDKLLGKESTDIDIALDDCSGEQFAEQFHSYLQELHLETHGFGVIRKNPEKSKHLETATIKVFDSWIDFVNLRGEEYDETSRIPKIVLGTPESDAYRRDFTINALFYNINENKVEDFTNLGINDLNNGFIRTPLDPLKTFLDDPLRILRGFRFSVRFGFKIDPVIFQAIAEPEVKSAFAKKISRERIGLEFSANFEKNPSLKNAFDFYNLIYKTDLWPLIFNIPPNPLIEQGFKEMSKVVENLQAFLEDFKYANAKHTEKDPTKVFADYELAQIVSLSAFTIRFCDKKIKDNKKLFGFGLFANSLKMPNKFADASAHIQRSVLQLHELSQTNNDSIDSLAMWQRDAGAFWKINERIYNLLDSCTVDGVPHKKVDASGLFKAHNLEDFWEVKPLLDGKEIAQLFEVAGPEIKNKQNMLMRWQARNPSGTREEFYQTCKKL